MTRFICLKCGDKYSYDYVNILASRVRHFLPSLSDFICYTDQPEGIDPTIQVRMLPNTADADALGIDGWWWKCWIVSQPHAGENIYMDLDILINGDCSPYRPKIPEQLGVLHSPGLMNSIINSSVLSWYDGIPSLWRQFVAKRAYFEVREQSVPRYLYSLLWLNMHCRRPFAPPLWTRNIGDQEVITYCECQGDLKLNFFPKSETAWLHVGRELNRAGSPAGGWDGTQSTVICKGPRNPHENLRHPLVESLWKKIG